MHAVSPIPMIAVGASPKLPEKGEMPGRAVASVKEFGELFRKNVGAEQLPTPEAAPSVAKDAPGDNLQQPPLKADAAGSAKPGAKQLLLPQTPAPSESAAIKTEDERKPDVDAVRKDSSLQEKPIQAQHRTARTEVSAPKAVPEDHAPPSVDSAVAAALLPAPAAVFPSPVVSLPARQAPISSGPSQAGSTAHIPTPVTEQETEDRNAPPNSASGTPSSPAPDHAAQPSNKIQTSPSSPTGAVRQQPAAVAQEAGTSSKDSPGQHAAQPANPAAPSTIGAPSLPSATHFTSADPPAASSLRADHGPEAGMSPVTTQAVGGAPPAPPASTAAANLYDRIDQGTAPVVLHSGAQHVAVGVHDPDLGWMEIKAQNASGNINASLLTTSGQTHAALAAQLPAIADYLQQRDVRIGTLAVHHEALPGNAGSGQGSASGFGSSGNGQMGNGSAEQQSFPRPGSTAVGTREPPASSKTAATGEGDAMLHPISYISVRA